MSNFKLGDIVEDTNSSHWVKLAEVVKVYYNGALELKCLVVKTESGARLEWVGDTIRYRDDDPYLRLAKEYVNKKSLDEEAKELFE